MHLSVLCTALDFNVSPIYSSLQATLLVFPAASVAANGGYHFAKVKHNMKNFERASEQTIVTTKRRSIGTRTIREGTKRVSLGQRTRVESCCLKRATAEEHKVGN